MAKRLLAVACALFALLSVLLGLALAFGGPSEPPPLSSVNDPFKHIDYTAMPPLRRFKGNDGAPLAYRMYGPDAEPKGSVVLVHGSAGSSRGMHLMAQGFAKAGYVAYALDIRGHGESGPKGQIGYIGQLEDDLGRFMREVAPAQPATLAAFSAGGGFALRFAGSDQQALFQSYLLLAPFISQNAPNYRANAGGWAAVGVPRIVALAALNAIGVHRFNDLPVTRFALIDEAKRFTTPVYSFALAMNFRPHHDFGKDIADNHQPTAVLAGAHDELFVSDQLAQTFRAYGQTWPVTLLPGIGHIGLTLEPSAINAAVAVVKQLQCGA